MKLHSSSVLFIFLLILTTAQYSGAQATAISEQDYWAGVEAGYTAARQIFPRRETISYQSLAGGLVTSSRTEISEYLSKGTYRTAKTVVRNGLTTVSEAIQIGTVRYCKDSGAEWKTSGCYQQPPSPIGDADEARYTVLINKDGRTLIRTTRLLKKNEADEKGPTLFVTEDRLLINNDGSVRERSIVKTSDGTKGIVSREISKFEYEFTLKPIDVPVKK